MIRSLAEKLWSASRKEPRTARTVVLKLKTSEFRNSHSQPYAGFATFLLRRTNGHRSSNCENGLISVRSNAIGSLALA